MKAYRISTKKWSQSLNGEGARIYGGRWNSCGNALLYCSENISLAMLEILVNASKESLRIQFTCTQILVPNSIWKKRVVFNENILPDNWNVYPHQEKCKLLGDKWIKSSRSLILDVPSAVNRLERNVLINPNHKEIVDVEIGECYPLNFSNRIYSFA